MTSEEQSAEPAAPPIPGATAPGRRPKREWALPKNPVTRGHVDQAGRVVLDAGSALGTFLAALGRSFARGGRTVARGVASVPPMVRALVVLALLMLLGIVGSIAWQGTAGLLCSVVVIPVCAIALGTLGQRRFGGTHPQQIPSTGATAPGETDLQRSVEYIDQKLTLALNAFTAERQQSAMIALFQAKTAIELTLGTEQSAATPMEALLAVDEHAARPRIRAGAKSALRESNSLAAS